MNELATIPEPSTLSLIEGVLQSGLTPESVSVVERLVSLKERQDKMTAERAFASAFAKLQADMPPIEAGKAVNNRDGTPRYKYAPIQDIMAQARGVLTANGFAITFDTEVKDDKRIEVTCTLIHIGGHSRSTKFACRIGGGPQGCSEAQADGAATTYAKRFALCAALNIVIEQDTDGADPNETITPAQAEALRERCVACNADIPRFVKFLKVEAFDQIKAKDFGKADAALRMKEAQK